MKLAQQNIFGNINPPGPLAKFGDIQSGGIGNFLNLLLKLMIVAGGLYALFNLVLAGYAFMSAGEDPKKMEAAWAKIWQTAMGLIFIAGAFVFAALFSWLIFGDPNFILNPQLPTIQQTP